MLAIDLVGYAVVFSSISIVITFVGTNYLISFLSKWKMTVLDYHMVGLPQIPRPGGPAIIAAIVASETLLFVLTDSLAVLGLALVTLISGIVGVIDDLKTLGGIEKPALLLIR